MSLIQEMLDEVACNVESAKSSINSIEEDDFEEYGITSEQNDKITEIWWALDDAYRQLTRLQGELSD